MRSPQGPARRLLAAIVLLAAITACSKKDHPLRPTPSGTVENPQLVVLRFRDAWTHRDTTALAGTLGLLFGSAFGCQDEAANFFYYTGPNRDSLLLGAARLFRLGSTSFPPASAIEIALDPLQVDSDANDPVHRKQVLTRAVVTVRSATDTLRLGGIVGFGLVRGDVTLATLPPDSTKWFIYAWAELSIPGFSSTARLDRLGGARRALLDVSTFARPGTRPMSVAVQSECDSAWATTWSYALRRYLE